MGWLSGFDVPKTEKNDSRKGAKIAKSRLPQMGNERSESGTDEDSRGEECVDAAIAVHRELGPGLLETVDEVVLLDELR